MAKEVTEQDTLALAKGAMTCVGDPRRLAVISPAHPFPEEGGRSAEAVPDIDLFHFVFSVCSQKVRTVLAEKELTYGSNELVILPPTSENYCPDYARLRMKSDAAQRAKLVSSYTGSTSVEHEGFDPLVVPTLVDHSNNRIIADSKEICLYLDRHFDSGTNLIPAALRDSIMAQMNINDAMPQAALLYGANPNGDHRPEGPRKHMPGVHVHKINVLKKNMASLAEDDTLQTAYLQKIMKEESASVFVNDDASMLTAIDQTKNAIIKLEALLAKSNGPWLMGDQFSMADIFWAVSLYRLLWLGYGYFWNDNANSLPGVQSYASRLFDRPSVRNAIINWPGHPPSEHVSELVAA